MFLSARLCETNKRQSLLTQLGYLKKITKERTKWPIIFISKSSPKASVRIALANSPLISRRENDKNAAAVPIIKESVKKNGQEMASKKPGLFQWNRLLGF